MTSRRRILVVALGAILLPVLLWWLVSWVKPAASPVDIAVARPAWTITVAGIPGEMAAVWVWTPRGTFLTNLTLPTELRLGSSCVFVQASNRPGSALKLRAVRTAGGACRNGVDDHDQ